MTHFMFVYILPGRCKRDAASLPDHHLLPTHRSTHQCVDHQPFSCIRPDPPDVHYKRRGRFKTSSLGRQRPSSRPWTARGKEQSYKVYSWKPVSPVAVPRALQQLGSPLLKPLFRVQVTLFGALLASGMIPRVHPPSGEAALKLPPLDGHDRPPGTGLLGEKNCPTPSSSVLEKGTPRVMEHTC